MGSQGWERLQEGMAVGGIVGVGMVGVQGRDVLGVGWNREAAVVVEGSPTCFLIVSVKRQNDVTICSRSLKQT